MCRYLLLVHFLIHASVQIRPIDPYSGNIESEAIRRNISDLDKNASDNSVDDTQHTESNLNAESNSTGNGEPNESNNKIDYPDTSPVGKPDNPSITPSQNVDPVDNTTVNSPFLPGSREDDPMTVLQSNELLEKETEKPQIHNSNVKYAGVTHSDTYVTNNFYNGKHEENEMVLRYLWMRIYSLHDAIEALPQGIKKMQGTEEHGNKGTKKKGLVITMDEKPTLTIDT